MNKMLWAFALFLLAAVAAPSGAQAQSIVRVSCAPGSPYAGGQTGRPFSIDENGNTCITGSISASLTGFTPGGTYATLTASGSSGSVALPAGATVAVQNTGTTTVSCTLGVGSATAVPGQIQVPASSTVFLTPGSNTFIGCIDETGSASNVVRIAGGSGLGTGFGGGGGGGGGGSSSITTWAGGTLGAMATYGTSPGAVLVPGMNAFVTNTVAVSGTVTATPTGTQAISAASGSIASGAMAAGSHAAGSGVDGWDLTQGAIADAAVTAGATGSISAKLRSISRDVMTVNTWGGVALGAPSAYGTSPGAVNVPGVNAFVTNTLAAVGNNADDVAAGAGAASPVASYNYVWDGTNWDRQRPSSAVLNPCETNAQSYATGVITSATTTRIVAPSASNKTYLCMFFTKASAADNVAVVEGTGGTCGTGTAALLGGTTTANGLVFGTAGDGLLLQAGGKVAVIQTAGTNVDTCLITSTAGPLIWSAKYVQAP